MKLAINGFDRSVGLSFRPLPLRRHPTGVRTAVLLSTMFAAGFAGAETRPFQFSGGPKALELVCTGSGLTLSRTDGVTTCIDEMRGDGVSCTDAGTCSDVAPSRTSPGFAARFLLPAPAVSLIGTGPEGDRSHLN